MPQLLSIGVGDEFATTYGATDSFDNRRNKLAALLDPSMPSRQKDRVVKNNTVPYGRNFTYLFDPDCNPWAIKFLCSYWGTCSWRVGGDGYIPIQAGSQAHKAWVHVDIATLSGRGKTSVADWKHGNVTGAHVVVQAHQPTGSTRPTTLKGKPAFPLTADDIYQLALLQFERCYKMHIAGNDCDNLLWPASMHQRIRETCSL